MEKEVRQGVTQNKDMTWGGVVRIAIAAIVICLVSGIAFGACYGGCRAVVKGIDRAVFSER